MDINDLRGVTTILVMIAFLSVCAWAFSSKRKARFTEAANLPFTEDDTPIHPSERENNNNE